MKHTEPFSSEDIAMSKSEFDQAIKGLLSKGIMEEVIVDGEVKYRLVKMLHDIGPHLNSDPKEQN